MKAIKNVISFIEKIFDKTSTLKDISKTKDRKQYVNVSIVP